MFLKASLTATIFIFSVSAIAAATGVDPYQSRINAIELSIKRKTEKIADLQEKLDGCGKTARGTYNCSGWNTFSSTSDVLQWKEELKANEKEAKKLKDDLKVAMANKDINAATKITLGNQSFDAGMLLLDVKTAQTALKAANYDIQALKLKFDNSILAEYTKQTIENSLKQPKGQQLVCNAVATCSDTKKSKSAISDMEKKLKSFEDFRKAQLELLKKSEMQSDTPAKPEAPKTLEGGGISI